jgi:hypothetical protein
MMKSLLLSTALLLSLVCDLHAADKVQKTEPAKDLCLLDTNKCDGHFRYDLLEKIKRLTSAIKLGTAVYTPEEVKHMENLLEEANQSIDDLNL